jgi:uncharacterized membrane-anchored protein YhcB (DUF1043 family)
VNALTIGAIIGMVVGVVGGICGILSLFYQRKQTKAMADQVKVMQDQLKMVARQEGAASEWASKYDQAAEVLDKLARGFVSTGPSTTADAYNYVFPREELRSRIERYLGHRRKFVPKFKPSPPTKEQLQNPVVQGTIQDVLDAVVKFKAEHTDFARALKL